MEKVRYHFKGRSCAVESFFPRADEVLNIIYQLKEEAKQICAKSR